MPSMHLIEEFLAQVHVAVVGVSRNPKDFSNAVFRALRAGGRTLYPVNPHADGALLEGEPSYRTLADVPEPVDGVLVMVPAAAAADVVRDAIARGIPRVWLHRGAGRGAVSEEAVALCRAAGVDVVDGACPLMFEGEVRNIHRLHRFFVRRRIAA
jgi:uncharacterized protein